MKKLEREDIAAYGDDCESVFDSTAAIYALRDVPTADVAPIVHTHWNKTCVPDVYQCNHCKKAVKMDFLCDSEVLREYCPKCGAKMDEEKGEQTMTDVLRKAIEIFGSEAQCKMAIEEMSELTKEICKHFRGKNNTSAIAEEIADVFIMLWQLKVIFDCGDMVSDWERIKLIRLERKIKEEEKKNER